MTSWVVADSSIFLASVLQEELTPKARAMIKLWATSNVTLAAPSLFQYEIIAVLRKNVYQGEFPYKNLSKGVILFCLSRSSLWWMMIYCGVLMTYLHNSTALQPMTRNI